MDKLEKKKRHTSGSRSKSKKSKPNDFSVELKPPKVGYWGTFHEQQSKTKTENSLNKSKGTTNSKKHSKTKKNNKRSIKESKVPKNYTQDISHSVSADRKHSLTKINKTEANYFEGQDLQRKIYQLKKSLSKIARPKQADIQKIESYYKQIQDSIQTISEPLYSMVMFLHQLYLGPFFSLLQAITPYSDLIRRKQRISREIEAQIKENQRLQQQLSPDLQHILKLKQQIQQNTKILQETKAQKSMMSKNIPTFSSNYHDTISHSEQRLKKAQLSQNPKNSIIQESFEQTPKNHHLNQMKTTQNNQKMVEGIGIGKGFKLDLDSMNRKPLQGYHEQFYSKIDEFSESWRNQALRQKRFQ